MICRRGAGAPAPRPGDGGTDLETAERITADPRQLGSTNLTYVVQGSSNLVHWTALCTAPSTNPPGGPGFLFETGTAYQRKVGARDTVPVEQATSPRYVRFALIWH